MAPPIEEEPNMLKLQQLRKETWDVRWNFAQLFNGESRRDSPSKLKLLNTRGARLQRHSALFACSNIFWRKVQAKDHRAEKSTA